MDALQMIVLAAASVVALAGIAAVVWRELGAPVDPPPGGRARLVIEVLLPATGLVALIVWLWSA